MGLSEVESALRAHPGVRDVAIVVREVISGEQELVACVVPETNYCLSVVICSMADHMAFLWFGSMPSIHRA